MAKEDFCFTYYDGDASRDMQHMDRLCRGAYNDLVIMQRKVDDGLLTIGHIKAVLGRDFENCWYALEIILKKEDENYYIEWVKKSVEKMKTHAKKQAEKKEEYWKKVNSGEFPKPKNGRKKQEVKYQTNTNVFKKNTKKIPLENEDGDGDISSLDDIKKNDKTKFCEISKKQKTKFEETNFDLKKICQSEGVADWADNQDFLNSFSDWCGMRVAKKNPVTQNVAEILVKKLKLFQISEVIGAFNLSVYRKWLDVRIDWYRNSLSETEYSQTKITHNGTKHYNNQQGQTRSNFASLAKLYPKSD